MEWIVFWFAVAIVVGMYASSKGRSGFGYFLLSCLLSPIIGFLFAAIASPNREKAEQYALRSGDLRKCPFCAELVKKEAIVCKHCGRDFEKKQPATEPTKPKPAYPRSEAPMPRSARKRLMQHFGIKYDGNSDKYVFESHRYDRLEDAVAYARKQSTE